jgi:hypothetical protein
MGRERLQRFNLNMFSRFKQQVCMALGGLHL